MSKILILDTPTSDCRVMPSLLERAGYDSIFCESINTAKEEVAKLPPGAVVVAAMKFRGGTATELINWMKAEGYRFPVIAIVDNLNAFDVYSVMRDGGAVDVVQRPAIDKQLLDVVGKYAQTEAVSLSLGEHPIPRQSEAFRRIMQSVGEIAAMDFNTVIFGESGTGKEQIAREIYRLSSRCQKPCDVFEAGGAALVGKHRPDSEDSEMYNRIKSYFKNAEGGTIIIKNVQLLSFEKQSVLLHILENDHADVRVICTADEELLTMVKDKTFRPNLFYKLRQADITIPPLRDTTEDIPVIADYLLREYASQTGTQRKHLDADAVKAMKLYPWGGNTRELHDVLIFAAFHTKDETITTADLNLRHSSPTVSDDLTRKNPEQERSNIIRAYQRAGNWKGAARLLGISERALLELRKKFGIGKSGESQI